MQNIPFETCSEVCNVGVYTARVLLTN
jgi:ATP-dependent RNA helicase MSS116